MDDYTKNLANVIIEVVKVLLVAGGGVWAYFRFLRERTHSPRIRFDITCAFHGPQAGSYLAEFRLIIDNEGLVIHRFHDVSLRVRGIARHATIEHWAEHPPRAEFPIKVIDDADVMHQNKYGHVFVEPGVKQELTYVATVDEMVSFVLARAEFKYRGRKRERTHSAERVFAVQSVSAAQPTASGGRPSAGS